MDPVVVGPGMGSVSDRVSQVHSTMSLNDDGIVEHPVALIQLREIRDSRAEQHRYETHTHLVHQTETECLLDDRRTRDSDVLVAGDLSGLDNRGLDPSTNAVLGHRWAASVGGRWVTTTTGAPTGWLSPQPWAISNSRRPATSAPVFSVSSRSISAPARSTRNAMFSFGLGTVTSPASYHSNSSPTWSFESAMNPSSDIVICVNTLPTSGPPAAVGDHWIRRCTAVELIGDARDGPSVTIAKALSA